MTVTREGQRQGAAMPLGVAGHPQPTAEGPVGRVCPFLVSEAGDWRSIHGSRAHVCSAVHPPARVAVPKQRKLCLVPAHRGCATRAAALSLQPDPPAPPAPSGAGLWPPSRTTPILLEPPGSTGRLLGPSRERAGQVALVSLMVVAFAIMVVARSSPPGAAGGALGSQGSPAAETMPPGASVPPSAPAASPAGSIPPGPPGAHPSIGAAPGVQAPGSPAGQPGPAGSPSAGPSLGTGGEASPSAAPRRYTVKAGDTLRGIAASFGVRPREIAEANGITDPSRIRIGQVLLIP